MKFNSSLLRKLLISDIMDQHSQPLDGQMPQLSCQEQTTIFRLCTGHCRMRVHMNRRGLSHTPVLHMQNRHQDPRARHAAVARSLNPAPATGSHIRRQTLSAKHGLLKRAHFIRTVNAAVCS